VLEPSIQELSEKTNISIQAEYMYGGKFASELASVAGKKCSAIAFTVNFNDEHKNI